MARKTRGIKAAAQLEKTASAGRARGKATHENPLLPHKMLRQMHASLQAAQRLERRAASLLRQKRLPGLAGREAALVGLAPHLELQDKVSAAPGDVMLRLLRGADAAVLMRELRAKKPRTVEENGVLPPLPRALERLAVAAGVALAAKSANNKSVVVAFLEPNEMEDEAWLGIVQSAGQLDLPIVFLCLDSPDIKKKARARLWKHLRSATSLKAGLELVPVIPVDGQDVVAMYRAAQESVLRARTGIGPTVLWCERWDIGPARDAAAEFEAYLAGKGLLPPKPKLS